MSKTLILQSLSTIQDNIESKKISNLNSLSNTNNVNTLNSEVYNSDAVGSGIGSGIGGIVSGIDNNKNASKVVLNININDNEEDEIRENINRVFSDFDKILNNEVKRLDKNTKQYKSIENKYRSSNTPNNINKNKSKNNIILNNLTNTNNNHNNNNITNTNNTSVHNNNTMSKIYQGNMRRVSKGEYIPKNIDNINKNWLNTLRSEDISKDKKNKTINQYTVESKNYLKECLITDQSIFFKVMGYKIETKNNTTMNNNVSNTNMNNMPIRSKFFA